VALAVVASAGMLGAGATSAAADSIAYVKEGNVWLSTPDGARQYQVTSDGGYSTVSQADDGRMVALRGDRLRTFDPQGRIINVDGTTQYDIKTPHSFTQPGTQFAGPFDPAISPNGMKIAYSWYYTQLGQNPDCNPSTGCQTVYGRQGTNYISPDGKSPYDKPGFKEQTGWVGPSWTSDGETIISDPIQVGNPDVMVHHPGDEFGGQPGGVSNWFFDPSAPGGLRDGELSHDRTKLAFVTGESNETIYLYRAKGGHPHVPENCYKLNDGVGRISSPSWSPDSTRLAYADAQGVHVIPLPSFETDCGTVTGEHNQRLVIPGATSPDWGPADVPPARPTPPGGGPTPPGGGTPPGGSAPKPNPGATPTPTTNTTTPPRGRAITLSATPRLKAALKKGLTVRLSGLPAGKVTVTATYGKKTVATAKAQVGKAGTASAKLRFTTKGVKTLKGKKRARLTLRAGKATTTVTLKR
jgi:hypothetical protein